MYTYTRMTYDSHHGPHMPVQLLSPPIVSETLKILLFLTSNLSPQHVQFLRYCWPLVVQRSRLMQNADVLLFATLDPGKNSSEAMDLLHTAYRGVGNISVIETPNPGHAEGAMLAMHEGFRQGLFSQYDWVIRLNPDVLILDDRWMLKTMGDSDVDAILVDCESGIHTDFTIFRPSVLGPKAFNSSYVHVAEFEALLEFQPIIDSERYRFLPGTWKRINCRVRGPESPVVHDHKLVPECKPVLLGSNP